MTEPSSFFRPSDALLTSSSADRLLTPLNLAGDYSYLSEGYYRSLDAELEGLDISPTTAEALDAYVVPIALEKAVRAGLKVPDYSVTLDRLVPPVLAYPVNPFSTAGELVLAEHDLKKRLKSLTRNGTYAVLCQTLPEDYRLDTLRVVLGRTTAEAYTDFAWQVFEVFGLPLMRVRVIVTPHQYLFSSIGPLPFSDLSEEERVLIESLGTWS